MKKKWIAIIAVAVVLIGLGGYAAFRVFRAMNGDVALTAADAERVALEHAGVDKASVVGLWSNYDWDDGIAAYEVEFHHGDYEYDYSIHADSGRVLECDREYDPVKTPPAEADKPARSAEPALVEETKKLTKAEAEAIALAHAGLTAEQVSRLRTEYDRDDGVPEYSVEFFADGWEYDYDIHAQSGKILSWDKDRPD